MKYTLEIEVPEGCDGVVVNVGSINKYLAYVKEEETLYLDYSFTSTGNPWVFELTDGHLCEVPDWATRISAPSAADLDLFLSKVDPYEREIVMEKIRANSALSKWFDSLRAQFGAQ